MNVTPGGSAEPGATLQVCGATPPFGVIVVVNNCPTVTSARFPFDGRNVSRPGFGVAVYSVKRRFTRDTPSVTLTTSDDCAASPLVTPLSRPLGDRKRPAGRPVAFQASAPPDPVAVN